MPCDVTLRSNQTITSRKQEVKEGIDILSKLLSTGGAKAVVGRNGAIAFIGWEGNDRKGITDACGYRKIMATGSAMAKAAIAKAEMLAGRSVDKLIVGQGVHSHDGGRTWHGKG